MEEKVGPSGKLVGIIRRWGMVGLRSGPESSGDSTIRAVSSWRIIVDPKRMAFNICQTTGSVAFNDSSSTRFFSSDIGTSLSPFIFHCALRT